MLKRALPLTILQYRRDRLLGQRVRELLRSRASEATTAEALAALLNVSSRTLHRQLHEEGTSLQVLKNEVRHEMAVDQLRRTTRPIKQVALAVGFRNEKSFSRAFLQWTGHAPRDFVSKGCRFKGAVGVSAERVPHHPAIDQSQRIGNRLAVFGPHQLRYLLAVAHEHQRGPQPHVERAPQRPAAAVFDLDARTFGYLAKASAMFGCAALQMPHQLVPNSTTAGPVSASIAVRSGCSVLYSEVMGCRSCFSIGLARLVGSSRVIASETQAAAGRSPKAMRAIRPCR
jgi:AraC-like DNA-binding protein